MAKKEAYHSKKRVHIVRIKGKGRVYSGAWCSPLWAMRARSSGECIEMKLTDIFHSINDFTIQLKLLHHSHFYLFILHSYRIAPAVAHRPLRPECWVHLFYFLVTSLRSFFHSAVCKWVATIILCARKNISKSFLDALLAVVFERKRRRNRNYSQKMPYRMLDDILVNIYLKCTALSYFIWSERKHWLSALCSPCTLCHCVCASNIHWKII